MKILALILAACTVRAVTAPRPLPRYGLNVCVKPCPVLASAAFLRELPWDVELADCCVGRR